MTDIITMLAEESEANVFKGIFSGWQGIASIVFVIIGVLTIYIGIKVLMGYRFFPEQQTTVIEEDNYIPIQAKVLQKKRTMMPDFNGNGETELIDWKIGYEVDGEKYTQFIPDDGYKKGDMIDIKYNPDNPSEYYIDDEKNVPEVMEEETENTADNERKGPAGYVIIAVGVMVIVLGVILML